MSGVLCAELEVESRVMKILADYLPSSNRKVERRSRLVEDLYVDSIGVVEIVMTLNEAFYIDLPESEVEGWRVVEDICCSVKLSIERRG